jgi:hypothetical protein
MPPRPSGEWNQTAKLVFGFPTRPTFAYAPRKAWFRVAGRRAFRTSSPSRGDLRFLGLRWLDVDFTKALIMLPQTKNGEGRVVYLKSVGAGSHSFWTPSA